MPWLSPFKITRKMAICLHMVCCTRLLHDRTWKKLVPSIHPGQVNFPAGQATFRSYLSEEQKIRQVICQLNHKKDNCLAQGKQNLRAACSKGKLEFKVLCTVPLRNKRTKTYAKYANAHMRVRKCPYAYTCMPMRVYMYGHTRMLVSFFWASLLLLSL